MRPGRAAHSVLAAITATVLAGCSPESGANVTPTDPAATVAATRAAPKLAVDGEGLRWVLPDSGGGRPLPFGTEQAATLASLERARGPAGRGINADCGAGPVDYANWADGLSLVFQNGRFAGWGLDRSSAGAIGTAAGIGPGSTRAALESAYVAQVRQTTLGTEFSAGGIHGVIDGSGPSARITDMWAGVSCVAR